MRSKIDPKELRSIAIPNLTAISKKCGKRLKTVHIHALPPTGARFDQSLESFVEDTSRWPGMFVEMDGSFVWVEAPHSESRSQIDGMIYDRNSTIEYVDLKGTATSDCWLTLFQAILGKTCSDMENLSRLNDFMRIHTVGLGEYLTVQQFLDFVR